jgi:penicillin-binding protein-related factor A (putative recombinase)
MLDKKQLKEKLNHCSLDLQRSAVAFYLQPKGELHQVFLQHAQKILREIKSQKATEFSEKISQLEKETKRPLKNKREKVNLADKILTLGCLLK